MYEYMVLTQIQLHYIVLTIIAMIKSSFNTLETSDFDDKLYSH